MPTLTNMIAIRSYQFEGGLLHLELDAARHMTDDEVVGMHPYAGPLLSVTDGEMHEDDFFGLDDFADL
jgi:hypothetical protein